LEWSEFIADHFDENADLSAVKGQVDEGVTEALLDDLNTPLALSRLSHLFETAKRRPSSVVDFTRSAIFLGFKHLNKPGFFHSGFGASLFESGPQIGAGEARQIHLYRTAVANNFPVIVSTTKSNLEAEGFLIKLNEAGVLFVGNKTERRKPSRWRI